jgi:hypothetical protein
MATARRWLLFGAGVAAGVLGCVMIGGSPPSTANAQPPGPPAVAGRYQISAFGFGYGRTTGGAYSERGAYIVDTQTGDVLVVNGDSAPVPIGSAARPGAKK